MKKLAFLTLFLFSSLFSVSANASTNTWVPAGYSVDAKLNPNVAFRPVPSSQAGACTWCSTRHGNYYWKIDFIAKNGCSNLYINSVLKDRAGNLLGSWYQKGFYTAPMIPKRLEIVTPYKDSMYTLTSIYC
jgi:hypothetical protein